MPKLSLNRARLVLLVLAAVFIALMLAGPGTMLLLAVAPSSVKLLGRMICPAGTNMKADWVRYSYSGPGQSNLEITCTREDGKPFEGSAWWFVKLFGVYFVLLLVPALYLSLTREVVSPSPIGRGPG